MKKSLLVVLTIILAAFLMTGVLFACAPADDTEEVTAIEMVKLPDKTYVLVGSSLDMTGAEINIIFATGQNRIYDAASIIDRLTITGFDSSVRQLNQTVTVEFGGQTASFTLDIVSEDDIVDVVFDSKGGTEIAAKKAIKNKPLSAYVEKPEPTREGRVFDDWYEEGAERGYDFATVVSGNVSLVAKWEVTVTFLISGAGVDNRVDRRFPEGSTISQETIDSIYADIFAEKDGYDKALYSDYGAGLKLPNDYFENLNDNKNVFCVYEPQRYYIYLKFNGATSVGGQGTDFPLWGVADFPMSENPDYPAADGWRQVDADFGSTINFGSAVKHTSVDNHTYDFRFAGWYRDAEYTDKWENNVSTVDRRNMTLYARFMWTIQFFSGTENTGMLAPQVGESLVLDEGETVKYSDFPEIPEVVYSIDGTPQYYPKEGYTGWWSGVKLQYKDDSTGVFIENQSRLKDELSLSDILFATGIGTTNIYVNYYRIPYTVYFEDFIAGTDEKQTGLRYGGTITHNRIPNKNNLAFDRWYLDKELTTEFDRNLHKAGGSPSSAEFKTLGKVYKAGDEGFDAEMANGMSYGVMTLYAGYTANVRFFKNGGNPDVVNSSTAIAELTQNVLLRLREQADSLDGVSDASEWWSDREGCYYRYAATASVPSIELWQGREGFWYYGTEDGQPSTNREQPVKFDRINRNENIVVYYAIVRYDVTYVSETSQYIDGFPGREFAAVLADKTEKVTYQTTAPERGTDYYLSVLDKNPVGGKTVFADGEGIEWIIEGWYTDTNFRVRIDLSTAQILNETVLYAKWERAGTEGLSYELIENGVRRGTYSVSRGTVGEEKIIVIPAKYNGVAVTTVAGGAFAGMTSLEKFYVTDNLIYIENAAFKNSGLKDGNMPRFNPSVELETAVFDGTDWLRSQREQADEFVIFNGNTLYLYVGGGGNVSVPDSVTVIGAASFASSAVVSLNIHNGVTAIRAEAFEGCSALTEVSSRTTEYFEASQLSTVGDNAFYRLANLERIDIQGDNYAAIDGVLYGMRNGEPVSLLVYPAKSDMDIYVLPETVSQVDDNTAFYNVENMAVFVFRRETAPTIPEYLFNKKNGAFGTFKNLRYILLPENESYNADYSEVWQKVWENASDEIRYNTIEVEYSSPVEMLGLPDNSSYSYGDGFRYFEPTASYLDFDGWFYKDEGGEYIPYDESLLIAWDVLGGQWSGDNRHTEEAFTLYAKWRGEISFRLSEDDVRTFEITAGEPLSGDALETASQNLYEKDGYLVRWKYTEGVGEDYLAETEAGFLPLRGGEVVVSETQIKYAVNFKSRYDDVSGEWISYGAQNVPYGEQAVLPENPEPWLDFLVFGGWYTNEALTEPWVSGVSVVKGDTTLYGRWLVPMTFIYEDYYTDEVEQYAGFGKDMTPPSVRMREGYGGKWMQKAEDGESYVEADFVNIREQREYYAMYTINVYTVRFDVNGGSGSVDPIEVEHGDSIEAPDYRGDLNGGMFAGWFVDRSGSSSYNFGTPVLSDITLFAQFAEQLDGASFRFNLVEGSSGSMSLYTVTARPENLRLSVVLIPSVAYGANNAQIDKSRVVKIGANAFSGCDSIRHLIIPQYITEVDDSAFANLPNLEMITVDTANTAFKAEDGILYRIDESGNKVSIIKVPAKVKIENLDVPETVTSIASYAFEDVANLTTVRLKASYVGIGTSALNGISEHGLRFFVTDRNNYMSAGDSPWRNFGDYVFSETIRIEYLDSFNGTAFSGDGYPTDITVLTELPEPEARPADMVFEGRTYTFGGWATDSEGYNLYDFAETVTRDLKLYARWVLKDTTAGLLYRLTEISGVRGYAVSKGVSTDTNIVIANFRDGYPVIAVAPNGFMQSQAVSVYIPYTVRRIYDSSFIDIPDLERVEVDSKNKYFAVENGALYTAGFDELIVYPASLSEFSEFTVNARTVYIWQYAFYKNAYLQSVTVSENVERIGYAAFGSSASLTSITLRSQVPPEITADPFVHIRSDIKIFVLGTKSVDYTEKSVAVKYRERYIDSDAHDKIYPLEARIFFMDSYDQATGAHLFLYQDVTVPGYAKALYEAPLRADAVFVGWFTQPYGGTEFLFTYDLVNDDTVLYAHWKDATGNNEEEPPKPYLEYLITGNDMSVRINRDAIGFDKLTEIVIASEHTASDNIKRKVTAIAEDGFANLPALKSVILPYTVTSIAKGAFRGCSSLASITLPGTVQTIGESVFEGCSKLKEVELPVQITEIPANLFLNCTTLSSVKVWGRLVVIGENSFKNCASLSSFEFGNYLTRIGAGAFENCSVLRGATLPVTLKSIGGSAFRGAKALATVDFAEGSNLDKGGISEFAFADCERLESIVLPTGFIAIADSAFMNCLSLKSVVIDGMVNQINANAFRNCRSLTSVEFKDGTGEALREIYNDAFNGCSSLKTFVFGISFNYVGANILSNCASLEKVVFMGGNVPETCFESFLENSENAKIYVPGTISGVYFGNYRDKFPNTYYDRIFPVSAKVTFDDGMGGSSDITTATHGLLDYPEEPQRYGYVFGGWRVLGTDENWDFENGKVSENGMTLEARWVIAGSAGLEYRYANGTVSVYRGTLDANVENVVIANYYFYMNNWLPVQRIGDGLLSGTRAKNLYIPETVTQITYSAFFSSLELTEISVSDDNPNFKSVEGVLYNKEGNRLLRYPSAKRDTSFEVPFNVDYIERGAFESLRNLRTFVSNSSDNRTRFPVIDGVLYASATDVSGGYNGVPEELIAYPSMRVDSVLVIPATVTSIRPYALTLCENSPLASFGVEEGNSVYEAHDGVLYRRGEGKARILVRFPTAYNDDRFTVRLDAGADWYVSEIAMSAFRYATALRTVTFDAATPVTLGADAFDGSETYVLVPSANLAGYRTADGWSEYSERIIASRSIVTYDFNNGDQPLRIEVEALTPYPSLETLVADGRFLESAMPTLAYSETAGWFDAVTGTEIFFDYDGSTEQNPDYNYFVFSDTSIRIKWVIKEELASNGLMFALTADGNGYTVTSGLDAQITDGAVIVPSYYNGLPVVSVYDNAFNGMTELSRLVLPETMKSIGSNAFGGCKNLANLTILATEPPRVSQNDIETLRKLVASGSKNVFYVYVRADSRAAYGKYGNYGLPTVNLKDVEATVRFMAEDGITPIATQKVLNGVETATAIDAPTVDGKTFVGWFDGDNLYDFSTVIKPEPTAGAKTVTLVAKYS